MNTDWAKAAMFPMTGPRMQAFFSGFFCMMCVVSVLDGLGGHVVALSAVCACVYGAASAWPREVRRG